MASRKPSEFPFKADAARIARSRTSFEALSNPGSRGREEISEIPVRDIPPKPAHINPLRATVREIDFKIAWNPTVNKEELWFYFSRWSNDVLLSQHGGMQGLVDKIVGGTYVFDNGSPSLPAEPYSSPLSLGNDSLSYVVYVLSAGKNWQFSRLGRPITTGAKGAANPVYYGAHRVWAAGANGSDMGNAFETLAEPPPVPRDGCGLAYLVADGASALQNEPEGYDHSINLHVDLIYPGNRYMPIVIDPDIRYPGGSPP